MWAIGCIFAELTEGRALFVGDSEIDQIFKIFGFCGTPTESTWPGISKLPDYKPTFPKFKGKKPEQVFNKFDSVGLDLLMKLINIDPGKRINA